MENITSELFLETCQTGDLLLYNTNVWYSRLIELASNSKYSHISMILRDPTYIDPKLKGLYILESCKESIPDSVSGNLTYGVQIIPLEHVLSEYKNSYFGNLYYRKLNCQKIKVFTTLKKNVFNLMMENIMILIL